MRRTELFTKTNKTSPSGEVSKNAQLLIRAGFIAKEMAGVYAFLPLGLKVVENIKSIVREEMNKIGSKELLMTNLQRKEVWEKTNRWNDNIVDIWFKTKLKDDTEVGLGWSHEEPIVNMMRQFIRSYKDLPVSVYQFQNKMRNELRAKSGIMRGREFVMKDMYSFHATKEDLEEYYHKVMEAYKQCYRRLGVGDDTYVTFASGGAFTKFSHEFQTVCDAGEDDIYIVPSMNIAYNAEIAPVKASANPAANESLKQLEILDDESVIGAESLIKALNIPITSSTKSMFYDTDRGLILAVVRADYTINEDKLKTVADVEWLKLASVDSVEEATGAKLGFSGLYNLPMDSDIRLIVDDPCRDMVNFETGANKTGQHAYNVNWERDVPLPDQFFDIKLVRDGDISPETGEPYIRKRTAEVGNIFNFGSQKTDEMELYYTDSKGEQKSIFLGSYGIGITRIMGVIAEKLSDEKGLVWPVDIAPAKVYLVSIGSGDAIKEADRLYELMKIKGIEVIYDDRDVRPGEKFTDGELMGIPHIVTVSDRLIKTGNFEHKLRSTGEVSLLTQDELFDTISQ